MMRVDKPNRSASPLPVSRTKLNRASIAVTLGLGALSLPCSSLAQTTDGILKRAQERFAQEEKDQASWSAEKREAADKALRDLKSSRCVDGEDGVLCDIVILCSRAPEIAGESLPDDKELMAANKALDDFDDDLKKLASAIGRMKIASARFQRGARAARDRCEAKVRTAFRSEVGADQPAKSDPDEAVEASAPNPIYDGPVAIRPMVTAPQLMRKVSGGHDGGPGMRNEPRPAGEPYGSYR
jgi:hypothetical protein